jgi:hypothetical protein
MEEDVYEDSHTRIDLGKSVFHLVGVNSVVKLVARKKCSREKLLHLTANPTGSSPGFAGEAVEV